ncbi:MAG: tyrosine-type recombinase/integrase, partial [bacterium]
DLLAEIPTAKHTGYVMPKIATDYLRHPSNVTNRVQALFKSCGIQTTRTIDGQTLSQVEVGFHSFRHSFVSLCRESGAPLSVVESIVGHSNPAMTRHYTHTSEAAAIAAVSSLPSMQAVDTKALPPAQSPHLVDAGSIRERLQAMTAKTWKSIRDEMLTMVSKQ